MPKFRGDGYYGVSRPGQCVWCWDGAHGMCQGCSCTQSFHQFPVYPERKAEEMASSKQCSFRNYPHLHHDWSEFDGTRYFCLGSTETLDETPLPEKETICGRTDPHPSHSYIINLTRYRCVGVTSASTPTVTVDQGALEDVRSTLFAASEFHEARDAMNAAGRMADQVVPSPLAEALESALDSIDRMLTPED